MDRDGVYAHLIFGPATVINKGEEGFREACFRAYNDWLAEFCSVAPDRLIGIPMLPETPEGALRELRRIAAKGIFRQANLQIAAVEPEISDARWEPFWDAVEDTGMILSFHVAIIRPPASDPATGKPASGFAVTKVMVSQFLNPFIDLFAWGILERHPKMKLVIAESGLGWLPWIIQDLDGRFWRLNEVRDYWEKQGLPVQLKQKPSEIFKRQVFTTFQDDEVAMHLLKFYGEDNLLWASDYPHPDSIWPHSRQTIETQMAHLSPELRKKLTHDNAAKLYGLKI
jgi:predicted TIM-barrel fold metal-dependent hydrolase